MKRSDQGSGKSYNILRQPSAIHRAFYGDDARVEAKLKARERQKFAPHFDRLFYGKRYIVPQYRQADYYDQMLANRMAASSLLVPCQIDQDQGIDDVANAALCNVLQAMRHGRPQLWLERELAEPFMRTQLPDDMEAADIHWRWAGFRVHLPKGILRLAGKDGWPDHDLMFIDICSIPIQSYLSIPEPYASEICALGKEYGWPEPELARHLKTTAYKQSALMIAGNLDGGTDQHISYEALKRGDLMTYAVVKPWDEAVRLGQIRRITNADGDLSSPYEVTETDHAFCEKMLHLALNILLWLGSTPLEYPSETVLRKPRLEGKHHVPGLYAARFVGASQLRPTPNAHVASQATGRHLSAHWRAGHWKRQAFGPKHTQRKYIWLRPYQTHGQTEPS
jgi:hypothetical protein